MGQTEAPKTLIGVRIMNLISFDVYIIPESGSEPVVIILPPDAALGVVAYSSARVVKLVPNYGLSALPVDSNKE